MIVACYARKSTEKINDSIENQFLVIDDYISHQNELKNAECILLMTDLPELIWNVIRFKNCSLKSDSVRLM